MRHDLTLEKVEAKDGWMTVPDQPGLGLTLNEDFIKEYLVAESGE
jgi:L-alanine-DL-glutamate epimerase-like enolase superfamily enzyme